MSDLEHSQKIREVDAFLLENRTAQQRVREIHPELCFWALAGRPMPKSKKTQRGFEDRREVLQAVGVDADSILSEAKAEWKLSEVAKDDVLDALVAAVTASQKDRLVHIPEAPEYDRRGLRMEMVFANRPAFWSSVSQKSLQSVIPARKQESRPFSPE